MIDRTASLRAIITGRGNKADFTDGARKCNKKLAHRRMRLAGKEQVRRGEEEMREQEMDRAQDAYDYDYGFPEYSLYDFLRERDYCSTDELAQEEREDSTQEQNESDAHAARLARRRARYHERKVERQVEQYKQLVAQLRKLDKKLEPESRHKLSAAGCLLVMPFVLK